MHSTGITPNSQNSVLRARLNLSMKLRQLIHFSQLEVLLGRRIEFEANVVM